MEKRDIARKAALAEAESVLRAVSYAPTNSSVKKDSSANGLSNSAEKVGEGDINAAKSADKNSSGGVDNPN